MAECPDLTQLEELATGRLESAELRLHVESCGDCRERSSAIVADNLLLAQIGTLPDEGARAGAGAHAAAPPDHTLPAIAGYRVDAELHRGGQGVVFDAVQLSTGRRVAVKVLLEGTLATPQQLRRFEREIDTVLRLRHPNVVGVHDRGLTADGRHFFAMEFVEGVALDAWVRARQTDGRAPPIGARAIVELLAKVGRAVGYAHQRGVIHRDLKPGNILIDGGGEPRVLDFGLAKPVVDEMAAAPVTVTRPGWFLGTLAYASPEQLRGDPDRIDVRTDVYSLGVLLFEALTGRLPHPVDGAIPDVLHAILEIEPRMPAELDRDLAAILSRALAKECDHRYPSAVDFVRDLERWLRGDPVDAQRGRLTYLLRKSVQRHRVGFAVAAAMVLVVVAAAVSSTIAWQRARHDAERARIDAETRAEETQMFKTMLLSIDPERARGRDVSMREVIDDATRRLDAELRAEPAIEAELRRTLGALYSAMGLPAPADTQMRRALAIDRRLHPEGDEQIAADLVECADVACMRSDFDGAEALVNEATALLDRLHVGATLIRSSTQEELARVRFGKGDWDAAERLDRQSLAIRRRSGLAAAVAVTLADLSNDLIEQRRFAEAEADLREALQIRRDRGETGLVSTAATLRTLGRVLLRTEQYEEAREAAEEAVAIDRKLYGDDDVATVADQTSLALAIDSGEGYAAAAAAHQEALAHRTELDRTESTAAAFALDQMACLESDSGDLESAERDLRAALAVDRRLLGDDHAVVAAVESHLVWLLYLRGRCSEALRLGRELEARGRRSPAAAARDNGATALSLAWIEADLGDFVEAERVARESLAARTRIYGQDHGLTGRSRSALGWILHMRGDDAGALELTRDNLERQRLHAGERHPDVAQSLHNKAEIERTRHELPAAEADYREAIELRREVSGEQSLDLAMSVDCFGWFLLEQRRMEEAEPLLAEALAIRRKRLTAGHPFLCWSLNNVGALHYFRGEFADAERFFDEAVAGARGIDGAKPPGLGTWLCNLGMVKLRRNDPAAAEPLLLESHQILTATRGPRDPQTIGVAEQLIPLFTASGESERAAEFTALVREAHREAAK